MLSAYRFHLALIICGIATAFIGLVATVIALLAKSDTSHLLARNLLLFSLMCLAAHSVVHC
jgi:hypothetical protein